MASERPDAAGLTRAKRKRLELLLERERCVAIETLRRAERQARSSVAGSDAAEDAELAREQGAEALLSARMRARLRDLENALGKLHSGTYGFSERSGRPIGYRRLQAIPWARFAADEIESDATSRVGSV